MEGDHFDSSKDWYMVVIVTNQGNEETIPGDDEKIKVRQWMAVDEWMDKMILNRLMNA